MAVARDLDRSWSGAGLARRRPKLAIGVNFRSASQALESVPMDPRKSHPIDTLRRLPLFTDLSDVEIALIANSVNRMRFDQGAVVFCEGDPCNELLIVEKGAVRIFKSAASGRRQLIGIERPGNSLGEVAIFDGGCYPNERGNGDPYGSLAVASCEVSNDLPSEPRAVSQGLQGFGS